MLLAIKLQTSASFRAVAKISMILSMYLDIPLQTPTHKTVLIWIQKIGYYLLTKKKELADDWILILDHSIQLGQEKLFVVFGIREHNIDFRRPLRYQDLVPLREISKPHWNGGSIRDCVCDVRKELGQIKYAVGDYGSDIRTGLRLAEIPHVHDITHKIALILEKLYISDHVYQEVTGQMSRMRNQLCQTQAAHIIPPRQRKKSRYHNLKTLSDYGKRALVYLDYHGDEADEGDSMKEHLNWIRPHRAFFKELAEICNLTCHIERLVKHQGLSLSTVTKCHAMLETVSTEKGCVFKEQLQQYFQTTLSLVTTTKQILCTSDIIESAFGKYKNYVSCNPMAGITNLALCISAFTCSLEKHEIQEALENTTIDEVKKWSNKHIGITLLKKRRNLFSHD